MIYISLFLLRILPIIYLFYYDWKVGLALLLIIISLEKDIITIKNASIEIINHLKK